MSGDVIGSYRRIEATTDYLTIQDDDSPDRDLTTRLGFPRQSERGIHESQIVGLIVLVHSAALHSKQCFLTAKRGREFQASVCSTIASVVWEPSWAIG